MKTTSCSAVCAAAAAWALFGTPAVGHQPDSRSGVSDAGAPVPTDTWEVVAERFAGSKADTRPSRDAVMRFTTPGGTEVRSVAVAGGQRVKEGDLLVRARDADVVALVEQQKLRADSDLEVKGAEAELELADFRYTQVKKAGTLSVAEEEELRIRVETAKIQVDIAKMRLEEQRISLRRAEGQHEQYRLEAPFDGIVEEVMVEVGQGVNESMPAIRIVNTERLWIDPYVPTEETVRLALLGGSKAWVLLDLGVVGGEGPAGGARLVEGRVLYVSPVADSVSQRRRVRVELENPDGWPAGTQARVRFTEPTREEWAFFAGSVVPTANAAARADDSRRPEDATP